jgi:hypothetical protein
VCAIGCLCCHAFFFFIENILLILGKHAKGKNNEWKVK